MCNRHTERKRTGCAECHPRPADTAYRSNFGGELPKRAGQTSGSSTPSARRRAAKLSRKTR